MNSGWLITAALGALLITDHWLPIGLPVGVGVLLLAVAGSAMHAQWQQQRIARQAQQAGEALVRDAVKQTIERALTQPSATGTAKPIVGHAPTYTTTRGH